MAHGAASAGGLAATTNPAQPRPLLPPVAVGWRAPPITGHPALVVPCGIASDGMPMSLQIAGRPFDEAGLFKIGHAFQQASDWHTRRPPD